MARLICKYYDIRSGEGKRTCMMFAYIFLIITVILIIKSIGTSLFLSNVGIEKLPLVFILVAVSSIVVISLYNRLEQSTSITARIIGTLIFSIASLLVFRFLLFSSTTKHWLYYLLYIWSALFGVTVVAQFWLLANTIFNAREAKRLFGLLGTGAIAGGICGGYITNLLAPRIQSGNLLVFASVILAMCIFIIRTIVKKSTHIGYKSKTSGRRKPGLSGKKKIPPQIIGASGLLTSAMLLIFFSVLCSSLIDYQFNALASDSITDPNRLSAFIGFWLSTLSLVSLAIQLLFTQIIIKTIGVCSSLALLPMGVFIGAFGVLISPTLAVAIALKLIGGSLRNSIHKSSLELLVIPVPTNDKNQTKTFIDVITDNVATGLSGILLIALIQYLGFTVQSLSYAVITLVGIQMYIISHAGKHYIQTFRKAIERRSIDFDLDVTSVHDSRLKTILLHDIGNFNDRQLLFILQLIHSIETPELFNKVVQLTKHRNANIRCRAISLLGTDSVNDATRNVSILVYDSDREVQIEALHYITRKTGQADNLREYISGSDNSVVSAALLCIARVLAKNPANQTLKEIFIQKIEQLLEDTTSVEAMQIVAQAISESGVSHLYPYIIRLLDHRSDSVRKRAVIAAGKCRYQPALSRIINILKNRTLRYTARRALISYGQSLIQMCKEIIKDQTADHTIRRELIKVTGEINSQECADFLLCLLNQDSYPLTSEVIRALQSLRRKFPQLTYSTDKLELYIKNAIQNYRIMHIAQDTQNVQLSREQTDERDRISEARALMVRTLKEKRLKTFEKIFRVLGLQYGNQDMADAFQGLKSSNSKTSAHSLEFLDSVLNRNLKHILIPAVEDFIYGNSEKQLPPRQQNVHTDEFETLEPLLSSADRWLQSCTLYLLGTLRITKHTESIQKYAAHPDTIISETAKDALKRHQSVLEEKKSPC